MAQPTTIREYRSSMTARYNQPSDVSTALVSVTHLLLGCSAVNSRLRRLGAHRACGSLFVVGLRRRLDWAERPSCCINRTTRFREQDTPRDLSAAWIRGLP